ncbi:protein adenylyltransferase SelO family protein, partial [Salmonella enterica]|uniref:protein adenylyltransferase SelO family protein n=1 Tax=Salmonella enterica TaxID=28901 RepID=UPI00398C49AC
PGSKRVNAGWKETVGIVMRLAQSHMRFGHFGHFSSRREPDKVPPLADFAIRPYWPQWQDVPEKYALWFAEVAARTGRLIAEWQTVGFAHGVMITDTISILGMTNDYCPFCFIVAYEHVLFRHPSIESRWSP